MLPYVILLRNKESKQDVINAMHKLGISSIDRMGGSRYIRFDAEEEQCQRLVSDQVGAVLDCSIVTECEVKSSAYARAEEYFDSASAYIEGMPDGSDVDILLVDQIDFINNEIFNGRFNYVDWYSYADGVFDADYPDGYPDHSTNFADEPDNHAQVMAAYMVSNNGVATNSNLYCVNYRKFYVNGVNVIWDTLKAWHDGKSVNPNTGEKNPTVVCLPIGFSNTIQIGTGYNLSENFQLNQFDNNAYLDKIMYRGLFYEYEQQSENIVDFLLSKGIHSNIPNIITTGNEDDAITSLSVLHQPSTTEQFAIQEFSESLNLTLIAAAGNTSQKVVKSDHVDYNNYVKYATTSTLLNGTKVAIYETQYYNRSTFYPYAILVGSVSNHPRRYKADFSSCGNAVDIYAPGEALTLSYNNNPTPFIKKGTSTSAALLSGFMSSYISYASNTLPEISTSGTRQWLIDNSLSTLEPIYSEDASNLLSIQAPASNNRVAYFPMADVYSSLPSPVLYRPFANEIVLEDNVFHKISSLKTGITEVLPLEASKDFSAVTGDWVIGPSKAVSCMSRDLTNSEKFAIIDTADITSSSAIQSQLNINTSTLSPTSSLGKLFRFSDINNTCLVKFERSHVQNNYTVSLRRRIGGVEAILDESPFNRDAPFDVITYYAVSSGQFIVVVRVFNYTTRVWDEIFNFQGPELLPNDGKLGIYYQNTIEPNSPAAIPSVNTFNFINIKTYT